MEETEDLSHVEEFIDEILDVLDLGNADGGYGETIYGLSRGTDKQEQLRKIRDIVKKYFSGI